MGIPLGHRDSSGGFCGRSNGRAIGKQTGDLPTLRGLRVHEWTVAGVEPRAHLAEAARRAPRFSLHPASFGRTYRPTPPTIAR